MSNFYGFHALRTVGKCTSGHLLRYGVLVNQTVRLSANHPFLQLASQLINQTVYPSVYQPLIHLASQLINPTVRRSFNQPFIPLSSQLINQTVSLSVYQPFIQLPNQFINKSVIQTLSHSFSQLIYLGNFCTQCKDTISSFNQNISIFISQILDSTIGHEISANHVAILMHHTTVVGSRSLSLFFIGLNSLLRSQSL